MNSKFCEAVPKFSKFGHGTATLHPDRITTVPYWFDQMDKVCAAVHVHVHRVSRGPRGVHSKEDMETLNTLSLVQVSASLSVLKC